MQKNLCCLSLRYLFPQSIDLLGVSTPLSFSLSLYTLWNFSRLLFFQILQNLQKKRTERRGRYSAEQQKELSKFNKSNLIFKVTLGWQPRYRLHGMAPPPCIISRFCKRFSGRSRCLHYVDLPGCVLVELPFSCSNHFSVSAASSSAGPHRLGLLSSGFFLYFQVHTQCVVT